MSKSDHSFSVMPTVSISRSRFARTSQHKTTINVGDVVPIYCDEVLPGDTRSFEMASLIRMNSPLAPLMDNMYMDYFAFFVPMRLTWVHAKEFFGENSVSAGIPQVTYTIPTALPAGATSTAQSGSLLDYMGIPINKNVGGTITAIPGVGQYVSALPLRAYALIWNRWFRNQNIQAPLAVDTSDNNNVLVSGTASFINQSSGLLKANKLADYFTKSLPFAQKGTPVSIPLSGNAPIVGFDANSGSSLIGGSLSSFTLNGVYTRPDGTPITGQEQASYSYLGASGTANLYADLSGATAATINQLRYAFQLQKLLEKDALYGSRYWEILKAHFGVSSPDATLQDPEFLGGKRQSINIDQVISTATGASTEYTQNTQLGALGANSVTGGKEYLFSKSFCEHGYIIVVAVARHDQTYCSGLNRMWSRRGRYDFYWPVFANLGAQEVRSKELYLDGSSGDDNVFGYQEAWSEYRYKPSIVTGLMRPNVTGSLDYWNLSYNPSARPTLGTVFIEQDRDAVNRCLTSTDFDFLCDFYFKDIAVRCMPTYSIPGLIDHH